MGRGGDRYRFNGSGRDRRSRLGRGLLRHRNRSSLEQIQEFSHGRAACRVIGKGAIDTQPLGDGLHPLIRFGPKGCGGFTQPGIGIGGQTADDGAIQALFGLQAEDFTEFLNRCCHRDRLIFHTANQVSANMVTVVMAAPILKLTGSKRILTTCSPAEARYTARKAKLAR